MIETLISQTSPLAPQKPDQIRAAAGSSPSFSGLVTPRQSKPASFARVWQAKIESRAASRGFHYRCATPDDLGAIQELHRACFSHLSAEYRPSELNLFRQLRFGVAIVVADTVGRLVGYNLLFILADRTALSCGIAVHPSVAGRGLGTELGRYSSLAAMAAGARVRRGTVKASNCASLVLFLNRLGAVCDIYHPRLGGPAEGRLEYVLPLTPESLGMNTINGDRLAHFLVEHRPGTDYRLLPAADSEELTSLYHATDFRVAALAPPGVAADSPRLVALPARQLGLTGQPSREWAA